MKDGTGSPPPAASWKVSETAVIGPEKSIMATPVWAPRERPLRRAAAWVQVLKWGLLGEGLPILDAGSESPARRIRP